MGGNSGAKKNKELAKQQAIEEYFGPQIEEVMKALDEIDAHTARVRGAIKNLKALGAFDVSVYFALRFEINRKSILLKIAAQKQRRKAESNFRLAQDRKFLSGLKIAVPD